MNVILLLFASIILAVVSTVQALTLKKSEKSDQITDCYYHHEYAESVIVFICSENDHEENYVFTPDVKTVCSNQHMTEDYDDGISKRWIEKIEFQNCERPKIPNNLFQLYSGIDTFNMTYLGLTTTLPLDSLDDVKILRVLNVSHNEISELPKNLLARFTRLSYADFSYNHINKIDADAFSSAIRYLNLGHNDISTLNLEMFKKLVEVKKLELSHNQIGEIPRFVLHKMNKLVEVDFSFNQITKIEIYAFSGHFNLEILNLAHNHLIDLERKIFRDENLKNLKFLNLSCNSLEDIKPGTFSTQKHLKGIDLSHNKLKTLNANILPERASALRLFSIEGNAMQELNGFTNARIPNATIVGISEFDCAYFNTLFKSLTWKHVDTVLKLNECKTIEEGTNFNEDSSESPTSESMVDDDYDEVDKKNTCTFYLIATWISLICLTSIVSAVIWFIFRKRLAIGNAFTGVSYSNNNNEPTTNIINQ